MNTRTIYFLFFLLLSWNTRAQQASTLDIHQLTENHFLSGIGILNELLSIPNDSHYPEQLWPNLEWCEQNFQARQWDVERLETDGFPLLLASKINPTATKTVLFYFHVDGQAVFPEQWDQPSPFTPTLKKKDSKGKWETISMSALETDYDPEWRIFARSASDDKGPLAMFLTAWDAIIEAGFLPDYSIKVVLDFEEEIGSPHLASAVVKNAVKLQADMMLIMDGPRHVSNEPTLSFGARGISEITLTMYGPRADQHSGHYGNYAPNPAFRLAQLLSSMKDEQGRVIIPGFYDGIVLTDAEKDILRQVPDIDEEIMRKIGIAEFDKVGETYQESIQYPSLNIRGFSSGSVGMEARTIVPAEAIAEIDVRLVPESDPERLFSLIRGHIENQGYHILDREPTEEERITHPKLIKWEGSISYKAFRTPFDSEPGIWLNQAMVKAFGKEPIRKRISGGSLPIAPFIDALANIPAVTVVTVNADNNQHGPNENIRLGNYKEGILTALAILSSSLSN
ncbi:MAG: M20/M25/M40 family metallo-hydrolase [Mongoliitalea sp.]